MDNGPPDQAARRSKAQRRNRRRIVFAVGCRRCTSSNGSPTATRNRRRTFCPRDFQNYTSNKALSWPALEKSSASIARFKSLWQAGQRPLSLTTFRGVPETEIDTKRPPDAIRRTHCPNKSLRSMDTRGLANAEVSPALFPRGLQSRTSRPMAMDIDQGSGVNEVALMFDASKCSTGPFSQ